MVLVSGGGGSWRNENSGNYRFVDQTSQAFQKAIILPHTFEAGPLSRTACEIRYFSRDSSLSTLSIPFATPVHDMAFFLQIPHILQTRSSGVGLFLRKDPERSPMSREFEDSLDISSLGNHRNSVTPFFQIISSFDRLVTDRMHVGIAGAMLGKKVDLYPSNYDKTKAVFDHSMITNFPNVRLREW
jgi:CDP-glycerol glycerophosphotransferase